MPVIVKARPCLVNNNVKPQLLLCCLLSGNEEWNINWLRKVVPDDQTEMSVVTGLVVGIIVIRLKACACSYMIHTEFVCFYVSVCLCKQSEKIEHLLKLIFSTLTTHILLVLPASHLTFLAVHSSDLFSFLLSWRFTRRDQYEGWSVKGEVRHWLERERREKTARMLWNFMTASCCDHQYLQTGRAGREAP